MMSLQDLKRAASGLVLCILFIRFDYISDRGELFEMVIFASVMTGISAPFSGLVKSRMSYLNAIKKVRRMQIMTFLSAIVYTIIGALILGVLFGSNGLLASNLLRILLLMLTVWLFYVISTKKVFPSVKDYLTLPDAFYLSPGDIISLDIRDTEDVSLVSEQIHLFCRGHNIDDKTQMNAALLFEEPAKNIIQFGFPECKKTPSIDLRLVFTEKELIMRLLDNCPVFNVDRYIAQQVEASPRTKAPSV